MERHCSIETAFSIASKRSICVSAEILIAVYQSRTGNEHFWKWNGKFRSDWTNRPRGPPLEVDHFNRKISTPTKASHLFFDQNFRKFWYNGKHPMLFLMAERGSLSGGAFLHTVGYCKVCAYRLKKRVTSNIIYYGARCLKRMGDEWMIRRGR